MDEAPPAIAYTQALMNYCRQWSDDLNQLYLFGKNLANDARRDTVFP
jgi:hypothetical protein